MVKLQLAIDTLDGDEALKLAASTAPYAGIFEAGTPFIKSLGINIVKKLKSLYPEKIIQSIRESGLVEMIHISASLLAADYARLGEEVQRAEKAGVDSFHFDIMDGHYVPNLALTPDHLKVLRAYSHLAFHTHLELANPDNILSMLNFVQADMIIVQWNTLTDPAKTFKRIRSQSIKVGLGFNPNDTVGDATRFFPAIDLFLLLGVYPGFGGQVMQPRTAEKIAYARHLVDNSKHQISIAVDGGVKPENAAQLVEAGADILIMGTALFQSNDMTGVVKSIRESTARSPHR